MLRKMYTSLKKNSVLCKNTEKKMKALLTNTQTLNILKKIENAKASV